MATRTASGLRSDAGATQGPGPPRQDPPCLPRRESPPEPGRPRTSARHDQLAVRPRQPPGKAGELAEAAEEGGHRAVVEDLADGPGEHRRDRQHRDLVEALLGGIGSVLVTTTSLILLFLQPVDRRVGEHARGSRRR